MNTASEIDISGLRCYDRIVEGVTYSVPRGITRETRGRVWIVRVLKKRQVQVSARFTDLRFGGPRRSLDAAIIHLLHSGHAWRREDVLQLGERVAVHWRKRSGVGLCAVAYLTRPGPGRGETLFLSTWRRIASGRGLDKFRAKLVKVLETAWEMSHTGASIPYPTQKDIRQEVDRLLDSEMWRRFLLAGQRKVDQIAVAEYVESLQAPGGQRRN